jgi:hypothetical protein
VNAQNEIFVVIEDTERNNIYLIPFKSIKPSYIINPNSFRGLIETWEIVKGNQPNLPKSIALSIPNLFQLNSLHIFLYRCIFENFKTSKWQGEISNILFKMPGLTDEQNLFNEVIRSFEILLKRFYSKKKSTSKLMNILNNKLSEILQNKLNNNVSGTKSMEDLLTAITVTMPQIAAKEKKIILSTCKQGKIKGAINYFLQIMELEFQKLDIAPQTIVPILINIPE